MEENNKNQEENKLTYEQLNAYAVQMQQQLVQLQKENLELSKAVESFRSNRALAELDLMLKCLELKHCFSEDFIKKVSSSIETVFSPKEIKEGTPESE